MCFVLRRGFCIDFIFFVCVCLLKRVFVLQTPLENEPSSASFNYLNCGFVTSTVKSLARDKFVMSDLGAASHT